MRWFARRSHLIVQPDSERVHTVPTPTAGGTAMLVGLGAALLAARLLPIPEFRVIFGQSDAAVAVLGAAAVMWLVGFIDDAREVSPPAKVAGQVLAAMVLYFGGVTMLYFKVPFSNFVVLSPSVLPLVTALWVIGIANAVNLIDGLDGLAAGVVGIGAAALCVYGLKLESVGSLPTDSIGPMVAAATAGLCLGFLPHNFHRAKIFMGDTGAMILGLLMAASTMVIGGQAAETWGKTYFFYVPLLVPFIILGVPMLDMSFAIVRRTVKRTGVAVRDLEHLHHRLMRLGHGHRRAVLVLWAWTFILSAMVLYGIFYDGWRPAVLIGIALLAVGLYTLFQPGRHRGEVVTLGAQTGPGAGGEAGLAGQEPTPALRAGTEARVTGSSDKVAGGAHRAQRLRRFARHQPGTRE
ncbi:MAG: MraY family glycosyltransferase [Acidimicrobiales bacterium]